MKQIVFVATISFLFFTSCDVRNKNKVKIDTIAVIDSMQETSVTMIDSVYDFGKVVYGEIVEYNYRFKNSGTKPLIISNVSASCGCTVPEKPEAPIQPGETGFIKVKFNSDKRIGEAHKTITVQSNANPSFPQLLLKGTVTAKPTTDL